MGRKILLKRWESQWQVENTKKKDVSSQWSDYKIAEKKITRPNTNYRCR